MQAAPLLRVEHTTATSQVSFCARRFGTAAVTVVSHTMHWSALVGDGLEKNELYTDRVDVPYGFIRVVKNRD